MWDKCKAPPVEVEVAAHRFASACKFNGWSKTVVLTCYAGRVDYMTYVDEGGETHTVCAIDGDWYEGSGV